jgi:hypothetical protein
MAVELPIVKWGVVARNEGGFLDIGFGQVGGRGVFGLTGIVFIWLAMVIYICGVELELLHRWGASLVCS